MCFSHPGHVGRICGDRRLLCVVRELASDPRRSTCPRVDLLLAVLCLWVGLALTPLSCSPLLTTSHPSPKTYITCQSHSVIMGLIKMLHTTGTAALEGCGTRMNDIHTCKCSHARRALCEGCCVQSPQGT